jgi:hypothetical protein
MYGDVINLRLEIKKIETGILHKRLQDPGLKTLRPLFLTQENYTMVMKSGQPEPSTPAG